MEGLTPRQRGRKQRQDGALREELDQLRRDKRTLERRLEKAETIIEVQRKLCTLLGMEPGQTEPIESG